MPAVEERTMMAKEDIKSKTKINERIIEPPMFKVIYLNDDRTSIDFVIESLIEHFDYDCDSAEKITIDIHEQGSAVVAILPFELAEQKGIEVTISARANSYPLQIKLEPEDV